MPSSTDCSTNSAAAAAICHGRRREDEAAPARGSARNRRPPASAAACCSCCRSAAARSSCFRSLTGSLTEALLSKLRTQRGQAATHALADDALRAAQVRRDLGVAALLEVVGLDRLALLGGQTSRVARAPERSRSSRCIAIASSSSRIGCIASARRASSWIRRLRSASLQLVDARSRTTTPAPALVPAENEAATTSAAANVSAARSNASSGSAHPTAKEGEHRSEVPLVENAKRLRACTRRQQSSASESFFMPHI